MYIQGLRDPQGRRSRHEVPRELQAKGPDDDQDRPPTTRQHQGFGKDVLDTWVCSVRGQTVMPTIKFNLLLFGQEKLSTKLG